MAKNGRVTLVLGNSFIAGRAAQAASARGDNVILGLSGPSSLGLETLPLKLGDYDSYLSIFQQVRDQHSGIDNMILAFTPSWTARSKDYIPGSDLTDLDDIVKPLMMSMKNVWYTFRRDQRGYIRKEPPKLSLFAAEGNDADTKMARNAVLGFWRTILVKSEIMGLRTDLVVGDMNDECNAEAITQALLLPHSPEPTVHIIEKGERTSQHHLVGQCQSLPIMTLGGRLIPLLWFGEKATKLRIRLQGLTKPPKSASSLIHLRAAGLRYLPAVLSTFLAYRSYQAEQTISALIFSLIASSLSKLGGTVLLALVAMSALRR